MTHTVRWDYKHTYCGDSYCNGHTEIKGECSCGGTLKAADFVGAKETALLEHRLDWLEAKCG